MAYVFRQGDLPKLDLQVDRGTDFKAWKSQWDAYISLSGLDKQSQAKQVQALTLCFSRETVTIVDNLGLTGAQRGNAKEIITGIQRYVEGQINESVERRNFRRRSQQQGESFDDFLVSLRELAKTCNFCSDQCTQKNIRDQIIEGLMDGDTVEDLLKEKNLTLDTTITKCRGQEAAKRQRAEITTNTPETSIQSIRRARPNSTTPTQPSQVCPGCGANFHKGGRKQCPAYNLTCHSCHKIGHFAKVCRARRVPLTTPHAQTPPNPVTMAIYVPTHHKDQSPQIRTSRMSSNGNIVPAPTIEVHMSSLNGATKVQALPDSGADISVAGKAALEQLGEHRDNLLLSELTPKAANGTSMRPIGKLPVTFALGEQKHVDDLHIYHDVKGVLLSWRAAKGLHILPEDYPQPSNPTPVQLCTTRVHTATSQDIMKEFPSVFDGRIKTMEGENFHISLRSNAKPFCVKTPRSIPFAYRDKLKSELDLLQEQGIIAPITEPTEWCAPIVITPKKDSDSIRMCVDLSHLNKYVKRERYQSATPAQAVADIAADSAKIFTKLDAMKGYHQCPLDEESQLLTTFITPFGRFKYLRAPYGISSISEHYNRRMDEAFAGLTGFRRIVDDVIIYDSNPEQHSDHVRTFLQRCADKKITLNTNKWEFSQTKVDFAGFTISAEGYHIDSSITTAISMFPTPSNRTDLRSFFGLANQLSASTSALAGLLAPLRPLLSTKNEFIWSKELDQAFVNAKQSLTSAPTLAFFDPSKATRLCTDASRQGLGFVLQQKHEDNWVLIQAGSRFLSDAETRYAVIELELLAVTWAIIKCKMFLAGLPHFTIITDHHPLIPILNNYRLDEIENPRLQRMKTRIMAYNYTAEWIKGVLNHAPDALSRNPVSDPQPHEMLAERDSNNNPERSLAEIRAISSDSNENLRIQVLRKHAQTDIEYKQLQHFIHNGFPEHRKQLPDECRRYWNIRTHLTMDDDLIVYGCRLLIPQQMRRDVLAQLHESHQGSVRTKQRARLAVYWPGIDNDIDNVILTCKMCQDLLPSNVKEPITCKPTPARPFQEVAGDFCSYAGQDYLILVDCYSDWPDIIPMGHNTTTSRVVTVIRQSFCRTGVPDIFWSDQGPQFTAQPFQEFSKKWGFKHVMSTPTYPQSNGKVEATVKSMKKLIRASWTGRYLDEDKLTRALLQYRNTPTRKDGLSPAQKLYSKPIQDTLPAHRRAFSEEWQRHSEEAEKQAINCMEKVMLAYNQHARTLPEIDVGSNVAIQNKETKRWDIYGIVTDIGPHRRYYIKTQSGRVLVRNRRFLRKRVPTSIPNGYSTATPTQPILSTPRRSSRHHNSTKRLVQDMRSFSVHVEVPYSTST